MSPSLHTVPVRSLTSRSYEDEHDLLQMQSLLMEARSRTDDWHYCHVGELLFTFFMVACHLNPQEHIRLWHDDEGNLVATRSWAKIRPSTSRCCPSMNGRGSRPRRWPGRKPF